MSEKVYARRPFSYGTHHLARGEVFALQGARNDEVLLRLRYVDRVEKGARLYEHGPTGRTFIEAGFRDGFGRAYQRQQESLQVAGAGAGLHGFVDVTGDAEERRLQQEAPLALEQTKASRR